MRRSTAQAYRLPATHRDTKARLRGTRKLTKSVVAISCSQRKEFFVSFRVGRRPAFVTGATMKPAGLAVAWTRRPAKPGRGADAAAPSRHQATHRGAGFVVARHSPAPTGVGLPEREMHLRRSRQVPRRAKRGALRSKVARGCARTPKGPQGAARSPSH